MLTSLSPVARPPKLKGMETSLDSQTTIRGDVARNLKQRINANIIPFK